MAHQKSDRLWEFEDSWTKAELYVAGYAYDPKVDQLRCDVLVNSKHFSGEYSIVISWADAMQFAAECETLCRAVEDSQEALPARLNPEENSYLSICVESAGLRKVQWQIVCRPAARPIEILNLLITTEFQLLNSIRSGIDNVWKRWPGPDALAPNWMRQHRIKRQI
jgi:hypothetical protein